jgi:hypothetical protein
MMYSDVLGICFSHCVQVDSTARPTQAIRARVSPLVSSRAAPYMVAEGNKEGEKEVVPGKM